MTENRLIRKGLCDAFLPVSLEDKQQDYYTFPLCLERRSIDLQVFDMNDTDFMNEHHHRTAKKWLPVHWIKKIANGVLCNLSKNIYVQEIRKYPKSIICLLRIVCQDKNVRFCVMKFMSLHNDCSTEQYTPCHTPQKPNSNGDTVLYTFAPWMEAICWQQLRPEHLYLYLNVKCTSTNYTTGCLFIHYYDTCLTQNIYNTLVEKNNDRYKAHKILGIVAQILFYTLGRHKHTHELCHNDVKKDNIRAYKTNKEYLYVKITCPQKGIVSTLHGEQDTTCETWLKIPTYGYLYELIDFGFSNLRIDEDGLIASISPLNTEVAAMNIFNQYTDIVQFTRSLLDDTDWNPVQVKPTEEQVTSFNEQGNNDSGGLFAMLHALALHDEQINNDNDEEDRVINKNNTSWPEKFYVELSNKCTGTNRSLEDIASVLLETGLFECEQDEPYREQEIQKVTGEQDIIIVNLCTGDSNDNENADDDEDECMLV
jgi:hypothetical protein